MQQYSNCHDTRCDAYSRCYGAIGYACFRGDEITKQYKYCFLFGPCKVVIRKSSAENSQSSSGVPSEQLVENWGRLLR
jgi:hypothetical protein